MKASELRIGNWVYYPHLIYHGDVPTLYNYDQIVAIDNVAHRTNATTSWISNTMIKPIPLTEEWLVKFGFESYHNDFVLFYKEDVLIEASWSSRNINTGERYGWGIYLPSTTINKVHQLQNLYFALTGEELTIEK